MLGRDRQATQVRWEYCCPHVQAWCPISPWLLLTLQDAAYHCIAFLFYFSASIFEAFLTIWPDERNEDKQHIQNISAVSPQGNVPCAQLPLPTDGGSEWKATRAFPDGF